MGRLLTGKIAKILIYDKGRVNGGTNYDSPGQRRFRKLVLSKLICLNRKNLKKSENEEKRSKKLSE